MLVFNAVSYSFSGSYTNGQSLTDWHPLLCWLRQTAGMGFQTRGNRLCIPKQSLQYWGDGAKHILQVWSHKVENKLQADLPWQPTLHAHLPAHPALGRPQRKRWGDEMPEIMLVSHPWIETFSDTMFHR